MIHGRKRRGLSEAAHAQVSTDAARPSSCDTALPSHTAVAGLCGLKRAVRSGRGDLPGECAAMSESVRRRLCAEWRKGDLPRASGSKRPAGLRGEPSVIRSRRGTAA